MMRLPPRQNALRRNFELPGKYVGIWMLAALPATLLADFSFLSKRLEIPGIPVAAMGARERGMGEAGMALPPSTSYFHANASRAAFQDKTSFTGTLETDWTYLQDDAMSNRINSFLVPTLAATFKTGSFGVFQAALQQSYSRNFEVHQLDRPNLPDQSQIFEGSLIDANLAWAYSPVEILSIGIRQSFGLSRNRFIETADFSGLNGVPPEAEDLAGDTTESKSFGSWTQASLTLKTKWARLGASFTPTSKLERTTERRVTSVTNGAKMTSDWEKPWNMAVGLAVPLGTKHWLAADYQRDAWSESDAELDDAHAFRIGYEFAPGGNVFDRFWRRLAYRSGAGFETYPLDDAWMAFGSLGVGIPLGRRGSLLDIAIKVGHREVEGIDFFREDILKLTGTLTGVGLWGKPARSRR